MGVLDLYFFSFIFFILVVDSLGVFSFAQLGIKVHLEKLKANDLYNCS